MVTNSGRLFVVLFVVISVFVSTGAHESTPLENAIQFEPVSKIQDLIKQGAPITAKACELAGGRSAVRDYFMNIQVPSVCLSALMLHADSVYDVRKLLHRGADVQYRDEHGHDARWYAHEHHHKRKQAVLEHEQPVIYQQLCLRTHDKQLDASFLRAHFTGLNRLSIDHACDQQGTSVLQQAVRENYYDGVRLLLDYGATGVQSALAIALVHGDKNLIILLMHRGGRLARVDDPLGIVMRENKHAHELVPWLAPLVGGRVRKRALLQACIQGDVHSAQAIFDAGAAMTYRDEYGTTPLFAALMSHDKNMVTWVLAQGGTVKLTDEQCTFAQRYFPAGCALLSR